MGGHEGAGRCLPDGGQGLEASGIHDLEVLHAIAVDALDGTSQERRDIP